MLQLVFMALRAARRRHGDLVLENLLLRHQLAVLTRPPVAPPGAGPRRRVGPARRGARPRPGRTAVGYAHAGLNASLALPDCGIQEYSGASRPPEGSIEGSFTIEGGHLGPGAVRDW